MRSRSRGLRYGWLILPWMLIIGCTTGDDDDDASVGDDDTSQGDDDDDSQEPVIAKLTVDSITVGEGGVVTVDYTLTGNNGSSFTVYPKFSYDGRNFEDAESAGGEGTTNLAGSPSGSSHTYQWDSVGDLGYVDTSIWFSLAGEGDGYELTAVVKAVQVTNKQYDKPCTIDAVEVAEGDGPITIQYTLEDEVGDVCDVRVEVEINGGKENAVPLVGSDGLEDVSVPPAGLVRHFIWDSEENIQNDIEATLIFTATDANNEEQDQFAVQVKNSPVPDPGEIIFTEILPWPDNAPVYLELYNTSNHTLNLQDVWLYMKSQTSSPNTIEGDIRLSPGVALLVRPHNYVVLAQSSAEFEVDWISGSIGLKSTDLIELWTGNRTDRTVLDSLDYNRDNCGDKTTVGNRSISLLSDFMTAEGNDVPGNWCIEQTDLTGYTDEYGTPGGAASCSSPCGVPAE